MGSVGWIGGWVQWDGWVDGFRRMGGWIQWDGWVGSCADG